MVYRCVFINISKEEEMNDNRKDIRRIIPDRRVYSYAMCEPERRCGLDRRCCEDRRN